MPQLPQMYAPEISCDDAGSVGMPQLPQMQQNFQTLAAAAAAPYLQQPSLPRSAAPAPAVPRSFPIPRGPQSFSIKPEQAPPLSQPYPTLDLASGLPPAAPQPNLAPDGSPADMTSAAAAAIDYNAADNEAAQMEDQPMQPQHMHPMMEGVGGVMGGDEVAHVGDEAAYEAEIQAQAAAAEAAEGRPAKAAKTRVGQSPAMGRRNGVKAVASAPAADSATESSYADLE